MPPNSSIPTPTINRPRRASRWIPRGTTEWGILVLGAVCAAPAAFYTAGYAYFGYACFDECDTRTEISTWALVATVIALTPFAVVRIYQGEHPTSARGRLAVTAGLLLGLATLTWCSWTGIWPP